MSAFLSHVLLLSILLLPLNSQGEVVRFTSIDYCPFTCNPLTEDGKEGIMTDVVRAAFEEAGFTLEIEIMPYVRAVRAVEEGKFDGIMVVGKYWAPELIYPELPTLTQRMMFMVKPEHPWRYRGYDSLSEVSVAVIKGFDYADDDINGYIKNNRESENIVMLHGNNTTQRGLRLLTIDRVDTYIEGEHTALYHIDKYDLKDEFIVAGFSARPFEDFTGFSPRSARAKEYAELLNQKIIQLKRSGELDEMLKRYGIPGQK